MNPPYVICHMCTTIDGKILPDRWPKLANGRDGGSLFETTAATFGIGAWIVGTTTMKEFAGRNMKLKSAGRVAPGDFIANPKAKSLAIGTDAKGVLRFQDNEVEGDHVVLLITEKASHNYKAHLRSSGVSYLIAGRDQVDLPLALGKLRRNFNLRKLMLQGGGVFNGAMLKAGMVDEISQVVVPVVDGGKDVTGVFDIPGPASKKSAAVLQIVSHKTLPGGVLWVKYKVIR